MTGENHMTPDNYLDIDNSVETTFTWIFYSKVYILFLGQFCLFVKFLRSYILWFKCETPVDNFITNIANTILMRYQIF